MRTRPSAVSVTETHERSSGVDALRIALAWGAIAPATMEGTEMAAGESTTQSGTTLRNWVRAVRSNMATNSRASGRIW